MKTTTLVLAPWFNNHSEITFAHSKSGNEGAKMNVKGLQLCSQGETSFETEHSLPDKRFS